MPRIPVQSGDAMRYNPEIKWELLFNEHIKIIQSLHTYPYYDQDPIRLKAALASIAVLQENISQIRQLVEKGGIRGSNDANEKAPSISVQ
jgi:hypothetical protein